VDHPYNSGRVTFVVPSGASGPTSAESPESVRRWRNCADSDDIVDWI